MQINIDPSLRLSRVLLTTLIEHGLAGVDTDDVEMHVGAAPTTLRRWVRTCRNPAICSRPAEVSVGRTHGHSATSPRPLARLPSSLHGPAKETTLQPRYAYSGRVRDRRRHGVTSGVRFLVRLCIPADPTAASDPYPRLSRDPRRRDTPELLIEDWREEIVRLAAHEARHVHQHRHDLPRSEADAERWAAARLEGYRCARDNGPVRLPS
ncbi:MAG: hypothetical protein WD250_15140 [Egibacteraceae bacterium]